MQVSCFLSCSQLLSYCMSEICCVKPTLAVTLVVLALRANVFVRKFSKCSTAVSLRFNCLNHIILHNLYGSALWYRYSGTRDYVTPALQQLHWLPIQARVQFKLCTLMHSIHNRQCPAYLSDAVQSVAITSTREWLRSAETINYTTPRLRSKFGERAFSHAGPTA